MIDRSAPDWQRVAVSVGTDLERAAVAVGRLDHAAATSRLGEAWCRRSLYRASIECLAAEGYHYEIERLFAVTGALPVSRVKDFGADARAVAMLRRIQSTTARTPHMVTGGGPEETDEVDAAQAGFEAVIGAPALLSGVLGFRSWLLAGRGPSAAMIALPAFLTARGLLGSPLVWLSGGLRGSAENVAAYPPGAWAARALRGIGEAASAGVRDLEGLTRLWRTWHAKLGPRRRNSRLAEVVDLVIAHPIQSPRQVARVLGFSLRGAAKLLDELRELGILVAPLSRRSWRVLVAADLAGMQEQLHQKPRSIAVPQAAPEPFPAHTLVKSAQPPAAFPEAQVSALRAIMAESDDVVRRVTNRLAELRMTAGKPA